ncbi:hypothetical protein KIPB_003207, partial [Kipferlia bialata]|eukprot:g3207.t1
MDGEAPRLGVERGGEGEMGEGGTEDEQFTLAECVTRCRSILKSRPAVSSRMCYSVASLVCASHLVHHCGLAIAPSTIVHTRGHWSLLESEVVVAEAWVEEGASMLREQEIFSAPELLESDTQSEVSMAKADVFSLGAVLYYIAT